MYEYLHHSEYKTYAIELIFSEQLSDTSANYRCVVPYTIKDINNTTWNIPTKDRVFYLMEEDYEGNHDYNLFKNNTQID